MAAHGRHRCCIDAGAIQGRQDKVNHTTSTQAARLREQFIEHRARLRDVATRILGCPHRADDVVQDTFIKIAEVPDDFDIKQPVAYLYRIVRNLAIDRHRRSAFECDVFTEEEDGLDVHQEGDSPEAIAISRQYLSMIGRALEGLPARTRRAFELYRLSGLTQREIAAELNISTTLVNFMIRDALACCRNLLQNEPELAGS
ncbi:RNA polymerase factor sigma-70 [Herbaspirillum seropedicae]|jgi:RNA polymerase sigma-70 factor (ECF subfamily)|nr:RNA polymerase factor sigma-70 [Herbaspirillum seropedicae]